LITKLIDILADFFDSFDAKHQKINLERLVVALAASGFVLHLLLISLARTVPYLKEGLLADLDRNFLHAVYTPFSFILFYEVLLLVFALPKSHTSSIGKQYEIVSLIVIRRVFKDIGDFRESVNWLEQTDEAVMVLTDMVAALLMFALVAGFHRLSLTVVHTTPHEQLKKFVAIKKSIAVLLCIVLLMLAAYNLTQWSVGVLGLTFPFTQEAKDLDFFFFPAFFEFMIFTDVFLLIVSIPFYERYEYVIRNAGFVISTILLRFSLSTPKPFDSAIAIIAIIYGLGVLGLFSYFTRVEKMIRDRDPD
jgi:hypothetical protein